MASCLAAFEPYPITNGYGSISTPWSSANNDAACYQQPGVLEPYPTGVWVPESLACDYLALGVTRVLSVTDRCPYNMRLRSEWAVRDFVFVKEIGTGNASTVWYAFCKKTSAPLAIKTYKKRKLSPLNRCQVAREINIHSQLDHPNIIALYAAFEDNDKVYLLQEYAEGGDLFDEMKRTMGRMPENQLVTAVLLPMMSALLAMHSAGFIHRDIKPENTLFAAGRVLKLADFGLAVNHLIERPVTRLGTLDYMAPEVLVCPDKHLPSDNKERSELWYTPAVDAWALGVLAYELAVGRPPFGMSTRDETIKAIRQCPPSFPEFMSPGLVDYISHALVKPADQRSTLADLMQHPWIMEHARRAGMDAQVLAYLRVHQPAERQLLTSAVPAIGGAAMQQQQQQQIAMAGAPAGPAVSPQQLRAELEAAAVAPAAAAVDATANSTAENVMPVVPNVTVAAPLISGSLNAAAAAAAAAADSSALSPSAAAAAASYLAGLVAADPQMLMLGGTNAAAAAATAAAAGMAASGGQARVKRTAKRTGMPRCYSSRNVPGLSSMASMGGPHQPGIPHGVGHIHWHANGEALALHVPGLALDLGASDSPRSSSPGANSPTAAAAAAGGARGVTRAASMMMPLYLQQQLTPQQQSLQQEQDGYNPLLGGLTGLIPGLAGMQAAAAAAGSQQALLPGSPTRRALAAARLNGGSNGSGGGSKQNSSSKRCTPEPDSDLAAALVTLGQSSPCSVDLLSPQLLQQQQLMQQYLRQQQTQLAAAGSAAPVPVAAAAAMHCQGQLGSFVSPNASPKPLSRLGPAGLSSSGSTAAALPPAAAAGCSGVGAMLAQQQQQLGQYGAAFSNCSCGSGPSMCAAASAAGSSSGRSSGTRFSPCSPILKVMTQHQFESPLKRVNSQGTINGGSGSGDRSAAVQLTPQRSLPIPLPPTQQQQLLQKQAEQQQQVPGVLLAADLDRLQHAAAAAAAAAACHSAGTPSPTAAAAAAAGCSVPCHRTTGSSSFEGSGNSGQASSAGLHMHELADVLSSPGSMANLWNEHQQQQQEAAAQQYLEQQQMAAQQQQQLCNRKINMLRPVMRACSAPSLLHPALQLQLLQQQQQQQQQQGGMGGAYDGLPAAAAAADLLALEQQQQCHQQQQQQCHQQQQQQQYMAASPFSLVNASLNLSIMDCGTPASPAAAAAARANSLGAAVAADQQVRMLTNNTLTNQRSGPLGLQGSGNLNGVITSHSSASLPPTPFYGASSPGLALLQQQGSTGQQQQQQLRQAAASWEAAAAAALAAVGSPHAMQSSPAAAAAVYGTAAELSLIQQHSSSGIESLSQPARASGISRSHSLLSELGPLQPVPESSAATYEQLPPALTTQSPSSTSWQQQQQLQDIAGVLLYQQQQQQAAQVAAVQLQMCGAAGLSSSSMADVIQQQQQQLVGVGVGVGCAGGQPPASPVNPRFSSRHAPSRLAHVSSPSVAAAADVAGDAQAGL